MTEGDRDETTLLERLRRAVEGRDVQAFSSLLADDVRWGDDDHPRGCRNRSDVVTMLSLGLSHGGRAEITELTAGRHGILCGLEVHWPEGVGRPADRHLFHAYLVEDDLISEIKPFDDREPAARVVGVDAAS